MFFLRTSLELAECVLHSVNQDYLQDWSFLIVQLRPIVRNFIITDNVCLHSENTKFSTIYIIVLLMIIIRLQEDLANL